MIRQATTVGQGPVLLRPFRKFITPCPEKECKIELSKMGLGNFTGRPIARVMIDFGAIAVILPNLGEPTFQNVVILVASIGLVLAFALKDYGSRLVAGLVRGAAASRHRPQRRSKKDGPSG